MKTYLYDYTNFGALYVHEGSYTSIDKINWVFSILRSCILDTRSDKLHFDDPLYKSFNNQLIISDIYINNLTGGIRLGDPQESNSLFVEKRQRAQLLAPIATKLVNVISNRLLTGRINEIGIAIHDTLALEIINSNPDENKYSPAIIEYASTLGITPSQAYTEIKLESDTFNSLKLRAYAVSKKYQTLIRQVTTQEQADQLMTEINQKLVAETRI
jgi:hypothetical protein